MVMGRVVLPLTILIGGAIDDFGSVWLGALRELGVAREGARPIPPGLLRLRVRDKKYILRCKED